MLAQTDPEVIRCIAAILKACEYQEDNSAGARHEVYVEKISHWRGMYTFSDE